MGAVDGWHCEGVGGCGTDLDSYVLGRVVGLGFFDWDWDGAVIVMGIFAGEELASAL